MSDQETFLLKDEQDEGSHGLTLSDREAFGILLNEARPEALRFSFGVISLMVSSFVVVFSGYRLGVLFDKDLPSNNSNQIIQSVVFIIALESAHVFFRWVGGRYFSFAAAETILNIRKKLFHHFQNLPLNFFDRVPQGRIITRLTSDVDSMEEFFTLVLGNILTLILMASMSLVAMLLTDYKIGLLLALAMIPILLLMHFSRFYIKKLSREVSVENAKMNSTLAEHINGIDLIRAYGLEDWSFKLFNKDVLKLQKSHLKNNVFYSITRPLTSFLCAVPLMFLVYFGGKEIFAGTLSIGMFVAFIRYCDRFYSPIVELNYYFHIIQKSFAGIERIIAFFKHLPESSIIPQTSNKKPMLHGNLEFQKVGFSYDLKSNVLTNVDFKIVKGEKIGLVGKTGSGKTSIVSLLMRLYEFQDGDILFEDHSIRDIEPGHIRERIGIVTQDVVIFEGSVRDNLSNINIESDDQILQACLQTGFDKILKKNKMTLDSYLKNGGTNLSVGERQLLSITRILLRKPDILILDEATANIDPGYEALIKKATDILLKGKTSLIIAHRLNTIKDCDRLVVLQNGEVAETGSFEDLLNLKGVFYNLYYANQIEFEGHSN